MNSKTGFLKQLQQMADEFIELSKISYDNLTREERTALVDLSKDKSIVITKADKGNAVVIQNVEDYRRKVQLLLENDSKFKKLDSNPTSKWVKKLQKLVREYKDILGPDLYRKICPTGARAGVMYGLPKIHKNNVPIRPIISAVDTYNYQLARYLERSLKPIIKNQEQIIEDTFDFVNKVEKYIVSFDVESLFTNVPTDETIELILKKAYPRNTKWFNLLSKDDMRSFLEICTKESHFQFNNAFYDQDDGVAMGSPLGPLFANIFMCEFERKHMVELKKLGVKRWLRYVDDIFATFANKEDAEKVLEFINKQHPNLKFTVEDEKDQQLAFLDVMVKRNSHEYYTTLYRKPTFTGVYLNWTSLTARKYKIGLIKCLLDRISKTCTKPEDKTKEIDTLKTILAKNDYPSEVIEGEIAKYLKPITAESQPAIQTKTNEQQGVKPRDKRYIVLPFVHRKADEFAVRLKNLVSSHFPQVDFNVAFKAPCTIGELFPFKDQIKKIEEMSKVVYKLTCETCKAEYIGETCRILQDRVEEHKKGPSSSVWKHTMQPGGHYFDFEKIEVIDRADSESKLKLIELQHIIKQKPLINKQLNTDSKYEIKTLIIAAHSDLPLDN